MQNLKYFLIAFLSSLIGFILVAWLILANVFKQPVAQNEETIPTGAENETQTETAKNTEEDVIEGESFTALCACEDDLTGRLDALVLLHVDKEEKQYVISTLPSYMVLNIDSIEYYLGDLVREKSLDFLLNKVYAVTGMHVDYYALFTMDGFSAVIDALGGVTFTVPQNMFYEDVNGTVLVDLPRGTRKLSGEQALQLVRFRGYDDGDVERSHIQREFVLTVFDEILKPENIPNAPNVFSKIVKYTNTNFTLGDFTSNIDLIFRYNDFDKVEVAYPGVYKDSDEVTRFIPKIDEAVTEYKKYR